MPSAGYRPASTSMASSCGAALLALEALGGPRSRTSKPLSRHAVYGGAPARRRELYEAVARKG